MKNCFYNLKVEYKSEKLITPSPYRRLLFRIIPSELSFFRRIFCNRWKYVYFSYYPISGCIGNLTCTLFSYNEAKYFIEHHKTYGDVINHNNKIYKEYKQHHDLKYDSWNF